MLLAETMNKLVQVLKSIGENATYQQSPKRSDVALLKLSYLNEPLQIKVKQDDQDEYRVDYAVIGHPNFADVFDFSEKAFISKLSQRVANDRIDIASLGIKRYTLTRWEPHTIYEVVADSNDNLISISPDFPALPHYCDRYPKVSELVGNAARIEKLTLNVFD